MFVPRHRIKRFVFCRLLTLYQLLLGILHGIEVKLALIAAGKGPEMAAGKMIRVAVDCETLKLAMALTGLSDPTELVEFALGLLTAPDPSADFARQSRGSLPGFDLDV